LFFFFKEKIQRKTRKRLFSAAPLSLFKTFAVLENKNSKGFTPDKNKRRRGEGLNGTSPCD